MSAAYDVVGYTYRADEYCPTCIVDAAQLYASVGGLDPRDTEHRLDYCANSLDIDRQDESTFDSDDFPKVIFRDQTIHHDDGEVWADRCGRCGRLLADVVTW